MKQWTRGLLGCGTAVLAVSAVGAVVAGHSSAGLTAMMAAATFGTNVFGGFGVDALKNLYRTCLERPGRPIDENHIILRNLRAAQLHALAAVAKRFDQTRKIDPDKGRAAQASVFSELLHDYLRREEKRTPTLSAADLAEPSDADAEVMHDALILRAPADFNASLSARHGAGPPIDRFRIPAEAAMLAELSAEVHEDIPPAFSSLLAGGADGLDGWFALFVRDAARRLRENAEFERIWQAEQTAALRVLAEQSGAEISAILDAIEGQTASLKAIGGQLDEIAGDVRGSYALLSAIDRRLNDCPGWLYFNALFKPEGWLRFHAFNRAIPFQGRDAELSDLHEFLHHADPFRWWMITAPGGAGKTRLALELCLRAHLHGWQVGFLKRPFVQPGTPWRPQTPTLIIADYAAEQVEQVRRLAVDLGQSVDSSGPVVRLLLLERQVDEFFWQRFLSSYGSEAGTLKACQHRKEPLSLPDLSEDDVWALVRPCPWRTDGLEVEMERTAFFSHVERIDMQRRALTAMLLADVAAETSSDLTFATFDGVLDKLVRRSRDHYWPCNLGAGGKGIGRAVPGDALIAAATMAGHLKNDTIDDVGQHLDCTIPSEILDDCARAIGSPIYPAERRLDGIQPDLIGEYFTLKALKGDRRDGPPFPWLPELAWQTDEVAMAAFVRRARQNFPDHEPALSQISITVSGKTESWWLAVVTTLGKDPVLDLLTRLNKARDQLSAHAAKDSGAAGALARLCWFATGHDRSLVPLLASHEWVEEVLALPLAFRTNPALRTGLANSLFNTLFDAKAEERLDRRDALLDELRTLAVEYPDDATVREQLAKGLLNTRNDAKAEETLDRRDALLDELRTLAVDYPDDATVREQLAMGLRNTLIDAKAEDTLDRRDALLDELRTLAVDYPDDATARARLAMGLFNTLNDAKAEGTLDRRDALLDELRTLAVDYPDDATARARLAMGLFNTLNDAKAEGTLDRRDALLDELRTLAVDYPDDATVREQLAMGLRNTLIDAKAEETLDRRDALLDELRTLAVDYPDDATVRTQLATGLFSTRNDAKAEDTLDRRDALLDELRTLAVDYPDDATVREQLAMGLLNTRNDAKAEDTLDRRDALLDELRTLAVEYPDDATVREQLAKGLLNTRNDAKAEETLDRRDALLDELRTLAVDYPDDATVREQLAMGLRNTLIDAKAEDTLDRRDALLDELRTLAVDYPDDATARARLAMGLFNTLNDAKAEGTLDRRDALLDELRTLAVDYPDDATVREQLAMGLRNTLIDAKAEETLDRRDALLDELRTLAVDYPDDATVRTQLATGLFSTRNDAKAEDTLDRRDALLDELRTLAVDYPDDATVREQLAMGLLNTRNDAKAEDTLDRRDALLDELRTLAVDYPDDATVRERLAKGLLNTLIDAKAEDTLDRRDALLDELRTLAAKYPDDATVRRQFVTALIKTGSDMEEEDEATRRGKQEDLLEEIRRVAAAFPNDPFMIDVIRMLDSGEGAEEGS